MKTNKDLYEMLLQVVQKLDMVLSRQETKAGRVQANAITYQKRKDRKLQSENDRRLRTVQNPDLSAFEWKGSDLWKVADAFAKQHKMAVSMLLMREQSQAGKIVEMLVRFWLDFYWERPLKMSGAAIAVFAGWIDRVDRPKAKRLSIRPLGDVVLLPSKFSTSKPWDGSKALKLGEPKMWALLSVLLSRVLFKLQYNEEGEEFEDWGEVNADCLKTLHLACSEGYSFSEDPKDSLCMIHTDALWAVNRDRFHKKVGKVMPRLTEIALAFQRALSE